MAARLRRHLNAGKVAEHGQYIFIYTSPKYNQIVYSLSRVLNNHRALKQLPFLGKHTKPGSLRRDAWQPLATVSFPSGVQGLSAYKQLREFRRRHELEWTDEEMNEAAVHLRKEREVNEQDVDKIDKEWLEKILKKRRLAPPVKGKGRPPWPRKPYWINPTQLLTRTRRERAQIVMMTSKANCIADLAAVLHYQHRFTQDEATKRAEHLELNSKAVAKAQSRIAEIAQHKPALWKTGTETSLQQFKALKREKMRLQRAILKPDPSAALEGTYSWLNDLREPSKKGVGKVRRRRESRIFSMEGVQVEWANLLDSQFASSWPESVLHKSLPDAFREKQSRGILSSELTPPTAPKVIESINPLLAPPEPVSPPQTTSTTIPTGTPPRTVSEIPPSVLDRVLRRLKHGSTT